MDGESDKGKSQRTTCRERICSARADLVSRMGASQPNGNQMQPIERRGWIEPAATRARVAAVQLRLRERVSPKALKR